MKILGPSPNNPILVNKAPSNRFEYEGMQSAIYYANVNEGLPKHEHINAHLTVCLNGKILVRKESKSAILTPEDEPLVLAGKEWHEIEALENGTIFMNQFMSGTQNA
jgi:hypothetical protein